MLHRVRCTRSKGKGEGEEGGGKGRRVCACSTQERGNDGGIDVEARMSSLLEPDNSERKLQL